MQRAVEALAYSLLHSLEEVDELKAESGLPRQQSQDSVHVHLEFILSLFELSLLLRAYLLWNGRQIRVRGDLRDWSLRQLLVEQRAESFVQSDEISVPLEDNPGVPSAFKTLNADSVLYVVTSV